VRDLAKPERYAKGRGPTRKPHRGIGIFGHDVLATRGCFHDAVTGQQRTLDLHVVHIGCVGDLCPGHGHCHRLGGCLDLRHAAKFLRPEIAGKGRSDGQAVAQCGGWRGICCRENQ
jgi:hypothetical protein